MSKFILALDDSPSPPSDAATVVYWARRDVPRGALSLDAILDRELINIRREHMNWAYAAGTLKIGANDLATELSAGDQPSMWLTSLLYERHPKLSPWLYPLYKTLCLESLLKRANCRELEVRGRDPLLKTLLTQLCAEYSIKLSFSKGGSKIPPRKSLKERIYFSIPAPLRALARYAIWLWKIKRRLTAPDKNTPGWDKTNNDRETATIITYFPNIDLLDASRGRFRSRYWEKLHDLLNAEARKERPGGPHFVRWLLIRFPSPDLTFSQCLSLRDVFRKEGKDGLSYDYLEEFITIRDALSSWRRYASIALKSLKLKKTFAANCHFKGSRLNFWPLAREQWAESFRGWRCLERCLQNAAFKRYVKFAGPQRWTLFPLENCPWERMATRAVKSADERRPVYGVQHSIIRRTDFRYFDAPETFTNPLWNICQPDIIGGNGQNALSQWLDNGAPKERLKMMEALRYLYLHPEKTAPESAPPEPGEPLEDTSEPALLVLTSFFGDETEAHLRLLGTALDAGILEGWRVLIKPHPYYSVEEWVDGRPEKQKKRVRILAGPLSEILKPGVLVWASNSTTASLEAVLKGLPVMVMLPNNDFDLCPIQNLPNLPRVATLDDLKKGLETTKPLDLPSGYLDLDQNLDAWRDLLGFRRD
ncbi:MAG: hypothetical protein HDQ93_04685 [Desulfovibrio sp.]|nr:hypothetical protein [Desulfovibrio sp.]